MKSISKWFKKYFIPHEANNHEPHFLRHESMLLFFGLIIIIELGFLVQVFVVFDKTKFLATVLPGILTTLTNEERSQNDAAPLVENALLDKAAQMKAEDMAKNGYFAHTSPSGITPWYWFDQVGYNYVYAGENLAVNFFESQDVANAWMNSPTHRANIVKKDYKEIGIGVANGTYEGRSTVFVAQLFGTPIAFATEDTTPEPTPAVTTKVAPTPTKATNKTVIKTPAKTTATPKQTTVVKTTPKTAPVVTPVTTKVLGEETVSTNTILATLNKELASVKSFIKKIATSPRQYVEYTYGGLTGIIVLALILILIVKTEIHHPKMILRGVGMVTVIIFLLFLNLRILSTHTKVPIDGISASVVAY